MQLSKFFIMTAARAITTQTITDGNGRINWVGVTLTTLLAASLIYAIRESYLNIRALKSEDTDMGKKIFELEHNLKTVIGNKYQKLP